MEAPPDGKSINSSVVEILLVSDLRSYDLWSIINVNQHFMIDHWIGNLPINEES